MIILEHNMANFKIPNSQGQIRQNNRSETFGELFQTFNLDLNRKFGKIYTSKKLLKVLDEDTDLGSQPPVAFEFYKGDYYLIADSDLYRVVSGDPTDSTNWAEETDITSSLNIDGDLAVFNDLLLMSNGGTGIYSYDGTTFDDNWENGKFTTTNADFTQMHVYRGSRETLFVCSNNKVHYGYNAGGSFREFIITLQEDLTAQCVDSGVNRVWVGTQSSSGSNAYVYSIVPGQVANVTDANGAVVDTVAVAEAAYKVEGTSVMSIEVIDNVPYIVTEKGHIQAFNGAGFSTVASFPFSNSQEIIDKNAVHPKGMKIHDDSLFINISTERRSNTQTDYVPDNPSGIWEFNRSTGQLHHRFGFVDSDDDKGAFETNRSRSGPIFILDNEYGLLLAAGEVDSRTASTSGVFADKGSSFGFFKTIEIESGTVQDAYERVYIKAKTLSSGESIQLKYRTTKKDPVLCDGAMKGTTQFNTTDDLSVITPDSEGTYNWEVFDINTGRFAQVTDIVKNASTYEVHLDTAIGADGYLGRFEFQNWTACRETYTADDGEIKSWGGFGTNPWIQFKVILNGAIELRQFMSESNAKNEV